MIDYEKEFGKPDYALGAKQTTVAATFKYVYGWMCAGLALSGAVAWYVALHSNFFNVGSARTILMVCMIAELGLVIALGAAIRKISAGVALLMFLGYAALNGLTLSVIFIAYPIAMISKVFFITAGMFGGLAVWGTVTKNDLSSIGSVCGMALWGLIIALIVNMFWRSADFDIVITFAGIIIFTGLTMYDAKKIKQMAAAEGQLDSATVKKLGILGALTLYLDFINLFLYLLRFFGRKK